MLPFEPKNGTLARFRALHARQSNNCHELRATNHVVHAGWYLCGAPNLGQRVSRLLESRVSRLVVLRGEGHLGGEGGGRGVD